MCGISGWQIHPSIADQYGQQCEYFMSRLAHRGPDADGSFFSTDKSVFLGHNRLSIIDLSERGNQPMFSEQGDALIMNGEIYNHNSLRKELIAKGHHFKSKSDTEIALKAFVEWGIDFTTKLKGMYAIAIWSETQQRLFLLRDPMGIKPLYYWKIPASQGVVFASELSAFNALDSFDATIDSQSINQYLEFGYTFDQHRTILQDVFKLPPGHTMAVKDGVIETINEFYVTPLVKPKVDSENVLEQLYETLRTVVGEHLIADVPVGLLLSGGLDSSLVASIASQTAKINTYSMGFADSKIDERSHARLVSNFIGSTHHEHLIKPDEILSDLESVVGHYDDLFSDWGMISTRLLYKQCQTAGMKVVLVGEGADELFAGYSIFKKGLDAHSGKSLEITLFKIYRYYAGRRYGTQYFKFRSIMKEYLEYCKGDLFSAIRMFETKHQLPNNYVMKVDKASMSLSIEARTPFLDSRIADIAYQLPKELLINGSDEKLILKELARRYALLPEPIISRQKFGSGIAGTWMSDSTEFRNFAKESLLSSDSVVDTLGFKDAMNRYFENSETGYRFPHAISLFENLVWRLLLLNLWSKSTGIKI